MENMRKKVIYAIICALISVYLGSILDQIVPTSTTPILMGIFVIIKPSKW